MQIPQLWTVFQLYVVLKKKRPYVPTGATRFDDVVLMKTMRTFDRVVGGDRTERINRHEPAQNVFIP